jgi:hypothetical protein
LGGSFFTHDVYEGHATDVEPRSYRLTANICRSSSLNGTRFTPSDLVQPTSRRCKNVASPDNSSLHVEARILLTTVAGMDRTAEGTEHMVIETLLFIAFVVVVGVAVVKAYEWCHDVLYGPYMQSGSIEAEATMTAISFTLGLRELPAATTAWHLYTVIIPRRTITGRLVRGKVWRRRDGRHWLYKKFIA